MEDLGGHLQYSKVQYSTVQEDRGLEATFRKDSSLSVLSAGTRSRDCRSFPRVACSWASVNTWGENILAVDKNILLCLYLVAVITAPVRRRHQPGPALVAPPAAGLGAELRGVAAPRTAAE